MAKTDVRNNAFADMKVVFPAADVAVITLQSNDSSHICAGQDISGTLQCGPFG